MMRLTWMSCLLVLLGVCQSAQAGWPFFSEDGLRRGTPEYYQARAGEPAGTRQKFLYGKMWPVRPRPVGPEQTFVHKYHSAHYWPHPYVCADREVMRSTMQMQTTNGWQAGTTLYDYHFDPSTNALNIAGQERLYWIMTHVPVQYRTAFVASARDPQSNSVRTMNVENEIARVAGNGTSIPVVVRAASPLGRPATEVDAIIKAANGAAPPPSITYQGTATGSGG